MFNLEEFKRSYLDFLRNQIDAIDLETCTEIITPFYDHLGDGIVLYIDKTDSDTLILTDDGIILNNLESAGVSLKDKRKDQIDLICRTNGLTRQGKEITIKAHKNDLGEKAHIIIQALLKIDSLYVLASNKVQSFFLDDVKELLNSNDIYYSEETSYIGQSGLTQQFDLHFQRNKNHPERLCETVTNPDKNAIESILFKWQDVAESRSEGSELFIVYNDLGKVSKSFTKAAENYKSQKVRTFPYSNLRNNLSEFE